jgi:hypothetical protein
MTSEERMRDLLQRAAQRVTSAPELRRSDSTAPIGAPRALRVIGAGVVALIAVLVFIASGRSVTRLTAQPQSQTVAWKSCSNAHGGYSISYPATWHEWTQGRSCSLFDPSPIAASAVFPDDWIWHTGHHPTAALQVANYPSDFSYVLDRLTQGGFETVVTQSETQVAGHRAVVVEALSTGAGAYPAGSRTYSYIVDHAGKGFDLSTVALADRAARFPEFKQDLDRAARTLKFRPSQDSIVALAIFGAIGASILVLLVRWAFRRRAV